MVENFLQKTFQTLHEARDWDRIRRQADAGDPEAQVLLMRHKTRLGEITPEVVAPWNTPGADGARANFQQRSRTRMVPLPDGGAILGLILQLKERGYYGLSFAFSLNFRSTPEHPDYWRLTAFVYHHGWQKLHPERAFGTIFRRDNMSLKHQELLQFLRTLEEGDEIQGVDIIRYIGRYLPLELQKRGRR